MPTRRGATTSGTAPPPVSLDAPWDALHARNARAWAQGDARYAALARRTVGDMRRVATADRLARCLDDDTTPALRLLSTAEAARAVDAVLAEVRPDRQGIRWLYRMMYQLRHPTNETRTLAVRMRVRRHLALLRARDASSTTALSPSDAQMIRRVTQTVGSGGGDRAQPALRVVEGSAVQQAWVAFDEVQKDEDDCGARAARALSAAGPSAANSSRGGAAVLPRSQWPNRSR